MPHEASPPHPSDAFDALVADFGPPSIESQKELFNEVRARHSAQWQESGILAKVVDAMHMGDGERELGLTRTYQTRRDGSFPHEVHRFRISYTKTTKHSERHTSYRTTNSWVLVSRTADGVRVPMPPFDEADAALVSSQVRELEALKAAGDLPNISPDLNGVIDPRVGLELRPPNDPEVET